MGKDLDRPVWLIFTYPNKVLRPIGNQSGLEMDSKLKCSAATSTIAQFITQVSRSAIAKRPLKQRAERNFPGQLLCTELLKIKGAKLELV